MNYIRAVAWHISPHADIKRKPKKVYNVLTLGVERANK
jgi:hypothetical protein